MGVFSYFKLLFIITYIFISYHRLSRFSFRIAYFYHIFYICNFDVSAKLSLLSLPRIESDDAQGTKYDDALSLEGCNQPKLIQFNSPSLCRGRNLGPLLFNPYVNGLGLPFF